LGVRERSERNLKIVASSDEAVKIFALVRYCLNSGLTV
jgi:hypothetical protein